MPPLPDPDCDPAVFAVYANEFEIGFNAFEFLFDFGQTYHGAPGATHSRIVTAPVYAKVFRALLDRSIRDYEAAFGTIPDPPVSE